MAGESKISDDLQARVNALAARSQRTPADIISDALEHGHSLGWQEHFLERVETGLAAADRGDFASAGEIERVLNRYRPS